MEQTTFFAGGRWRPACGGAVDVIEAATGEAFARLSLASTADIDAAVAAARAAQQSAWATLEAGERRKALLAFADALERRAKSTAKLVSRENGMPAFLSIGVSGHFPAMLIRYYADLIAAQPDSDVRPGLNGTRTQVTRAPVGVVAAITPWNYPQTLAVMKLAPALAAGCSVVLKPAPETSLDALVFAEAALDAGLPDGVVNIVPGDRDAGAYLVAHPGVDRVAFTGSTAAGRVIGETCGRLLRPVTLELGGKSAAILAEDVDLEV